MNDEVSRYSLLHSLRFLMTPGHECSYLENREAVTLFVDPLDQLDARSYGMLAELGFRRSGEHVYRPHCPACNECVPVRVKVKDFSPSRSQRRVLRRNKDVEVEYVPADYKQSHFDLYRRYMAWKHCESSMNADNEAQYMRIMRANWMETLLIEFKLEGRLIGVAITDKMHTALSAVYTFFDPQFSLRSPGTFSILKQIEFAREEGLEYLYLGYWIADCQKMSYKNRFAASQFFNGHRWLPLK